MGNPDGPDMNAVLHEITRMSEPQLRVVFDACKRQRKVIDDIQASMNTLLEPGTTVTLKGLSPKYLNGTLAEITSVDATTITVRVTSTHDYRVQQKVSPTGIIRVPAQCVEKWEV